MFGTIGNLFNEVLTFPIFNALVVLYHLFGDFALAIVVLTLIIKLVLFPLTLKQLKSTKATQQLQPHMQEIKKKYANDQQAQAKAMQDLYKEYGVNPVAGCLPLLVQLPVLYGLYYALRTVVTTTKLSDVNAHIYPFITKFQHFPDITFRWFAWLSFLNPILHTNWSWTFLLNAPDPTHILPVLAGLATFLSLRLAQPKTVAPVVDKNGKPAPVDPTMQSMKMMQYIMPFFTGFLAWSFPAGLGVYWTVSSLFQAGQQYFVTGRGGLAASSSSSSTPAPRTVESSAKVMGTVAAIEGSNDIVRSNGTIASATSNGSTSGLGTQAPRRKNGSASARRRSSTSRSSRR